MSKTVDINKQLSEEDARYLTVFERTADISRAKSLGTWPEGFGERQVVAPEEQPEEVTGDTNVPEQGDGESNSDYAERLTIPQMRELIDAYGSEDEQANAPAKSAKKPEVKAHVVAILDRLDRETADSE